MDTFLDFAIIGFPALVGLLGWIILRQRNAPPLVAGCSAVIIALSVMTAFFVVMYFI